jgi:hypothetical protein
LIHNTAMSRCPNGCSVESFEKWECSAVLDDGTGQATLYADGDVVPTLLGMTRKTVEWIEAGVRSVPDGYLVFKKTVPPSRTLQKFLKSVMKHAASGSERLHLLPLPLKAEYLLQLHCRQSNRHRHPRDMYVRCKPLPEQFCHLRHTSCDSYAINASDEVKQGETFVYSLPQLKLELVSFSIASNEG